MMNRFLLAVSLVFGMFVMQVSGAAGPKYKGVKSYLPKNFEADGSTDCTAWIQKALDENVCLKLEGSGDEKKPFIYGIKINPETKIGLTVHEGCIFTAGKGAVIRRLPSAGSLIMARQGAVLRNLVIDGNKKAHWPEFKELGKHDSAFELGGGNLVEDCFIYDNPGSAFSTFGDRSLIRRCSARNTGYIDIKFKANYYQSKWDNYSGDSFYLRGHDNIAVDCDSIDAFRWDYTTSHSKTGGALYVNCNGHDEMWRTYGFIDIEECDGEGTTMINCHGADGSIAISTGGSTLIGCEGKYINCYSADDVILLNNSTHGGGLAVGGWSTVRKTQVRGGNNPVVVGNVINRDRVGPGVLRTSDWSLSVFSSDEKGIVAGNILNEFQKGNEKGPGMKLDKVVAGANAVKYGEYKGKAVSNHPMISEAKKKKLDEQAQERLKEFTAKIPGLVKKLGIKGTLVSYTITGLEADFIKDQEHVGEKAKWFVPGNKPKGLGALRVGEHWDSQIGQYHNAGWYFMDFPLDTDLQHNCNNVYLLFGGVDSECRVWLNGSPVGEHEGWKDPFALKVPWKSVIWEDEENLNKLSVKVSTSAGYGGMYGFVAALLVKDK